MDTLIVQCRNKIDKALVAMNNRRKLAVEEEERRLEKVTDYRDRLVSRLKFVEEYLVEAYHRCKIRLGAAVPLSDGAAANIQIDDPSGTTLASADVRYRATTDDVVINSYWGSGVSVEVTEDEFAMRVTDRFCEYISKQ